MTGSHVIAALVAGLVVGYVFHFPEHPPEPVAQPAQSEARYQKGPYVSQAVTLAEGEAFRIVVVPNRLSPFLDTRCYVYTHKDLHVSSMSCGETAGAEVDLAEK